MTQKIFHFPATVIRGGSRRKHGAGPGWERAAAALSAAVPPPGARAAPENVTGATRPPFSPATDLGGLWRILVRRHRSILALTGISLALAMVYLWLAPPVYSATTTLFIDPRPKKIVSEDASQGGLGPDLALLESQVAIIRSDAVLARVVDRMGLDADPEFVAPPAAGWKADLKALLGIKPAYRDPKTQALVSLVQRVGVRRAQKTYVVDIEATSSDPVKAARLTQAIVDAYLADQASAKTEEARSAYAMIDGRLGALREQVRKAELGADSFRKANGILSSEGGTVGEQQLTRLNTELIAARSQAAEAKARASEVLAAAKTGNPDVITDPAKTGLVQRLREQLAQVARREASLSSQLLPGHPVVVDIRSQSAEIRSQIASELKRIAATARSEYQIAEAREREIEITLEAAKVEVGRTNTAQIKLRELEGEVAASRELLRVFLARSKETEEQQKIAAPDARVISPASVPARAARPVPALILSLGLLAGLAAGIVRALALDHMEGPTGGVGPIPKARKSTGNPDGVETLGALPVLPSARSLDGRPAGSLGPRIKGAIETSQFGICARALSQPCRRSERLYRDAVLRLLARVGPGRRGPRPERLLIAAATSGVGTASAAFALAYAAALEGRNVLLIDAASAEPLLSRALAGPMPDDRAIQLHDKDDLFSIATRDNESGLTMLPIALADLPSLSWQQHQRLIRGLDDLASEFDLVVIDGGGALDDRSAGIMLPLAERVLLLARADDADGTGLAGALRALGTAANFIAGVVIVGMPAPAAGARISTAAN